MLRKKRARQAEYEPVDRRLVAALCLEDAIESFKNAGDSIQQALDILDAPETRFVYQRLNAFRQLYFEHERFFWTFNDAAQELRKEYARTSEKKGGESR